MNTFSFSFLILREKPLQYMSKFIKTISVLFVMLLAAGCSDYDEYEIRSNVGEGLSVAASAKLAAFEACQSNPGLTALSNENTGYGAYKSEYVSDIQISGSCAEGEFISTTITTTTATGTPSR